MNINDLVEQSRIFCDELVALSRDIDDMDKADFVSYGARTKSLLTTLSEHKKNLIVYCQTYKLETDPYLVSLLDLMMGFLNTTIHLFEKKPTKSLITAIQGEIGMVDVCINDEDYSVALNEWREKIIFENRLSKYTKKLEKEANPLSALVGEKISPSKTYLRPSIMKDPLLQDTQTYYRSEKHPWAKKLKERNHVMYPNHDLKYGARAHIGSYGNLMQMMGDKQPINKAAKLTTTKGSGLLYNAVLDYKNHICQYVVDQIKKAKPQGLTTIKVGFFNQYPCLMVYLKPSTVMRHAELRLPSEAAFEAWVELLMGYLIASINHTSIEENGLNIELERRSSLGYLTPTISPTGRSMRINLGVVPRYYADLLVNCLIDFDTLLKEKILNKQKLPPLFEGVFYNSTEHQDYLGTKRAIKGLTNLFEILWAPADASGRTTLQNIARTPYALDGVTAVIFNALHNNDATHEALNQGISWAIKQLRIEKHGKKNTLSFKQQSTPITYRRHRKLESYVLEHDTLFWNTINTILSPFKQTNNATLHEAIEGVEYCYQHKEMNHLYYFLEQCCELTLVSSIEQGKKSVIGDGYGSDSETEASIEDQRIYAKKVIVHNGMRAIWCAIIATTHYLKDQNISCNLCLDSSYYEAPLGVKLITHLHELTTINVVENASSANTLLFDLNACITNGNANRDYTADNKKILILDATSALTDTVKAHVQRFACSRASILFVVESGLKHQQIFSDKNQYGTIRIFTKSKALTERIYSKIKMIDPPILSGTSHAHRRQMKALGAVPVTSLFFEHKLPVEDTAAALDTDLARSLII